MITLEHDIELLFPGNYAQKLIYDGIACNWIGKIKRNLEDLFQNDPNIFIAENLLWYTIDEPLIMGLIPNLMIVFGRPKGDKSEGFCRAIRTSYKQWLEDNIPPQVIFDVISDSDLSNHIERKREFYADHGVEEYYLYHSNTNELQGWIRQGNELKLIAEINHWISPKLKIKFELSNHELEMYHYNNERFF